MNKPKQWDILGPCPCTGPQHFCTPETRAEFKLELIRKAAPELLEALKYIKFSLNTFGSADPDALTVLKKLDAAIAKATGGAE